MDFNRFKLSTILKSTDLTPTTQRHLGRVYRTLFASTLTAAATSYLQIQGYVGDGWVPWSFLGGLLCMLAVKLTASQEDPMASSSSALATVPNERRVGFLLGFSAFQGISLGPLLSVALYLNPYLVVNALVSASLMFLCFSLSALFTRRRSYLFLGGLLSSALSITFWFSFFYRIFGSSPGLFPGELAIGLLIFSGYVLYDTQVIVERSAMGSQDVPGHALDLFVDAVGIFVRLLMILMDRSSDDRRRRRRRNQDDE